MDAGSWGILINLLVAVGAGGAITAIINAVRDRRKVSSEGKKLDAESLDVLDGIAARQAARLEQELLNAERKTTIRERKYKREIRRQADCLDEWHEYGEKIKAKFEELGVFDFPEPPSLHRSDDEDEQSDGNGAQS